MREDVLGLGDHIRDALWKVESAGLPSRRSAGLVVAGMGGSAIGGRLAAAAIGPRAQGPLVIASGYDLPPWVDSDWTVLCSSYSGSTEETLAAYDVARERDATVIAACTGGELAARAREHGVPVIPVAGGFQPRAAVGYALVAALEVAALCGVAPSLRDELEEAAATTAGGWPDDLAEALAAGIGVIHGAELTAPVAYRWKCQLNENANVHAFWSELPEANHNEVEGWYSGGGFVPVFLDDPEMHPRNRRRMEITAGVAASASGVTPHSVIVGSGSRTKRLVHLVMIGDLVSLEVAERRGADPYAIPGIDLLKAQLAGPEQAARGAA